MTLTITLAVLVLVIATLAIDRWNPAIVMLAAVLLLVLTGVLPVKDALSGFSNTSVITIASLFVVGAGLRATGALEFISRWSIGNPTPKTGLIRLLVPVSTLSAFMNNTPLVAFYLPVFVQLAKRMKTSPSKLLIPLSYAAILGGTITLVGTSTNLSVDSVLREEYEQRNKYKDPEQVRPLGFWELSPVGLPIMGAGLLYLVTIGKRLLPDRQGLLEYAATHPREYSLELSVRDNCPLAGQSVRAGGLRDLPGLYLFRIERGGTTIAPVTPNEIIRAGDILCFSGVAESVVDLQRIRGLDPVEHRASLLAESSNRNFNSLDSLEGLPPAPVAAPRTGRQLCEVVISPASPLIGQSIRDADFRQRYNAAIVAVHRSGEKLQQKIGQIVLCAGDTLLIDASDDFVRRWRHSTDFILVSGVEDSAPVLHDRAWVALVIFLTVVVGMSLASSEFGAIIALAGAVGMLFANCLSVPDGQRAIDISILVLVATAIGLSKALEGSGTAKLLADGLVYVFSPYGPIALLAVFYLATVVLSELLNNNATAALMSSLALTTAAELQINPRPLVIGVCVAASCAFATPIGYQTNLMVLNPGGYRFRDYLTVGLPLNLVCFAVAMIVIPLVWM